MTASTTGLQAGTSYTIDWGDGTTSPATTNTHVYQAAGPYTVTLTGGNQTPVTAPVTVNAPIPPLTLSLTPNPALVGQTVTANVTGLQAGTNYIIDWGDGRKQTLAGSTPQLTHSYTQPGSYVVTLSGGTQAPVTAPAVVTAPVPQITLVPNPAEVDQTVTITMSNLLQGVVYTLDWGDGTSETVQDGTLPGQSLGVARLQSMAVLQRVHIYRQPGTYTVTLRAAGLPPGTAVMTVRSGLSVLDTRLHFVTPQDTGHLQIAQDVPLTAVLEITYSGQGTVVGDLLLDGQVLQHVRLLAPVAGSPLRQVITLPTRELGGHTLEFVPERLGGTPAAARLSPQVVTYLVGTPAPVKVWPSAVASVHSLGFDLDVNLKVEQGSAGGTVMQVPRGLRVNYFFDEGRVRLRVDVPGHEFQDGQARVVTYDARSGAVHVLLASTLQPDPDISPEDQQEMGRSLTALTGDLWQLIDPARPFARQTTAQFVERAQRLGYSVVPGQPGGLTVVERVVTVEGTAETSRLTFNPQVGAITSGTTQTISPQQTVTSTSLIRYAQVTDSAGQELVIPVGLSSRTTSTLTGDAAEQPIELPVADLQLPPGTQQPVVRPGEFVVQSFSAPNGQGLLDVNTTVVFSDVTYAQVDVNNPNVHFPEVK